MRGVVQLRTDVNGTIADPGCEALLKRLNKAAEPKKM